MIRRKALRKIFTTTLTLFILMTIYLIPKTEKVNTLKTNLEVKNNFSEGTNTIYLLNKNNYLVKTKVFISSTKKEDKVKEILNLLINKSEKLTDELKPTIPENTKVEEVIIDDDVITINFSKEILNANKKISRNMISSIIYSLIDLEYAEKIKILVNGDYLKYVPNTYEELSQPLDKNFGINKIYNISSRKDIEKVVIYYNERIDNEMYYVPVTKYLNDSRSKIEIIVDELSSSYIYDSNLMSFLDNNIKLLSYEEKENVMFLNFNKYLFNNKKEVLEEVIYTIAYSVFDNYDVNMVSFEVDNKEIKHISKKDMPKK